MMGDGIRSKFNVFTDMAFSFAEPMDMDYPRNNRLENTS